MRDYRSKRNISERITSAEKGTTLNKTRVPLPSIRADLLLLHAPAVFDFRERRDIYFPFPGTSGDVPITPFMNIFRLECNLEGLKEDCFQYLSN